MEVGREMNIFTEILSSIESNKPDISQGTQDFRLDKTFGL